jgi:HK97 family phage prohead protease
MRLAGYAALFDVADGAGDTIRKGAFASTLAERREALPLFWQHNPEQRIGTVELAEEDARGLRVIARIDNPESRAITDLVSKVTNGLSFGYRARAYRRVPDGRLLEEIELLEVSLVTHPLQPNARVHLIQ